MSRPEACHKDVGDDPDFGTMHCTKPKGHDGGCGSVLMLAGHCHHPTEINGRCSSCGTGLQQRGLNE